MHENKELQTIEDVVRYLEHPLADNAYKLPLTENDIIEIVGKAITIEASERRDEWEKYPQLGIITSLMIDLELPESMVGDHDKIYKEAQSRFKLLKAFVDFVNGHDQDT